MATKTPDSFSQESAGTQVVELGSGKWWGRLLIPNEGVNKASHPYKCALGCGHSWTTSGCNATKQASHVCGDVMGVVACKKATDEDKRLANSFRVKPAANQRVAAFAKEPKRARAESWAGFSGYSSPIPAASSTPQYGGDTAGDPVNITGEEPSQAERDAVAEELRTEGLKGMFRHANTKANSTRLDMKWAEALAHCGLPPTIIENEYFRDAILQTSMAPAPYSPAHRTTFEQKLLPAVDSELSTSLRLALGQAPARTLQLDGWEELVNFILSSPAGDEFLGDVDMLGKDKTATATANLTIKYLKLAQKRYGFSEEQRRPTTIGLVTDNPTVMQSMREMVIEKVLKDSELYQPYFFAWNCLLHAISSLLGDIIAASQFLKNNLDGHKLITNKVRKRPWLRAKLLEQQVAHKDQFMSKGNQFRPLTVKRHGATRMGSVPRSAERNITLRFMFSGVASLPEFDSKCGIKKAVVKKAADDEKEDDEEDDEEDEAPADEKPEEKTKRAKDKKEKSSKDCLRVKELVRSDTFWEDSEEVQAVLKPLLIALRHADEERSLMGFVWPMLHTIQQHFTKLAGAGYEGRMPQAEREAVLQKVKDRWIYMHSPLHSLAYALNPRFVGTHHFDDSEVKQDCIDVLTKMLPRLQDVSDALDEYNQYHKKQGLFAAPLLWIRAMKVSPSNFWAEEAPKVKWLNWVGSQVLSLTHAAGGAERNWSTHGFIRSDLRRSLTTERLERYVRVYRNMRLRDRALGRGVAAQKQRARALKDPKEYPLHTGEWSSCDESDNEGDLDAIRATMGF